MTGSVVIVGAGQAGIETAIALRRRNFGGRIVVVGEEPDMPYQRPPLSKDFVASGGELRGVHLRNAEYFAKNGIELRLGRKAAAIDRAARTVRVEAGEALDYDHLVLATGARNRMLDVPGLEPGSAFGLRTLAEARQLIERLSGLGSVAILGGGFIGLELASVLRGKGVAVDVVEAGDRLMRRVVSRAASDHFRRLHERAGTRIHLGTTVLGADRAPQGWTLALANGEAVHADAVMLAVGVAPNVELAAAAGLPVADGIIVDDRLVTADPAISAIGDCAAFPSPHAGRVMRLESVQNATEQARAVAARLAGTGGDPYTALPWFWSQQGGARLQIAGLGGPEDEEIAREGAEAGQLAVLRLRGGRLMAVETVNDTGLHTLARRALSGGVAIMADALDGAGRELKDVLEEFAAGR